MRVLLKPLPFLFLLFLLFLLLRRIPFTAHICNAAAVWRKIHTAQFVRNDWCKTKCHQVTDFVVVYQSLFFIIWSIALCTYIFYSYNYLQNNNNNHYSFYSYTVFEMIQNPTHYISLHRFVPPVDFFQCCRLDTSGLFLQSLSRLACADGSCCASSCLHSVFGI